MKVKILHLIFFVLFPINSTFANECQFDQHNQEKYLINLSTKYQGSTYNLEDRSIKIIRNGEIIIYTRGGCEHFGESVVMETKNLEYLENKKALFERAKSLAIEFFSGFMNKKDLDTAIKDKDEIKPERIGDKVFFFIHYKYFNDFFISFEKKGNASLIEISYYY